MLAKVKDFLHEVSLYCNSRTDSYCNSRSVRRLAEDALENDHDAFATRINVAAGPTFLP
jgi:hypothetical protein